MILSDIVEQHAEEAAHLWSIRDRAVLAPDWNAGKLADLDERIEAHLDGLRVAGSEGWEILRETLPLEEPGEIFAAGVLAFSAMKPEWVEPVVEAAVGDPLLGRGLISAIGWLNDRGAAKPLRLLLASPDPSILRLGLRASAIRRTDPGPPLGVALSSENGLLRAAALRTVGELAALPHLPAVLACLMDEDPECRFWAAWSGALLGGDPQAVDALVAMVTGSRWEQVLPVPLLRLDFQRAGAWPGELMADPLTARQGIRAAGLWGDPTWIPSLLERMDDSRTARAAGEAFCWITGVDLALARLRGGSPLPSPEEKDEDAVPPADPDEGLEFPSPQATADWWQKNRSRFPSGRRFLLGQAWSGESIDRALTSGSQRLRAASAVAWGLTYPGSPLPEIRRR